MAFKGNPYDGHILKPQLEQVSELLGKLPKVTLIDRSYKGRKEILEAEIKMPGSGKGRTADEKITDRARYRLRTSVEP